MSTASAIANPLEDKVQEFIHQNPSLFINELIGIENSDIDDGYSDVYPINIREKLTDHSKRIDNLLIDKDGNIYLIEAKRDIAYREVISQALDYAAYIDGFNSLKSFLSDLQKNSSQAINCFSSVSLNERPNFKILITAQDVDPILDRIGRYLLDLGVPINFVRFRYIEDLDRYVFIPHYSMDLVDKAIEKSQSGESIDLFHITLDFDDPARRWKNWREHNFISAGGGESFYRQLEKLQNGGYVVCRTTQGFLGVAKILDSESEPISKPIHDSRLAKMDRKMFIDPEDLFRDYGDKTQCEWIVDVQWIDFNDQGVCKELAKGRWGTCKRIAKPERIKAIKNSFLEFSKHIEENRNNGNKSPYSKELNEKLLVLMQKLISCEDLKMLENIESILTQSS